MTTPVPHCANARRALLIAGVLWGVIVICWRFA